MAIHCLLLCLCVAISHAMRLGASDLKTTPFKKTDRIAIIGAGPGGVHMASRLKQMGYDRTTLFERSDRVGGKSLTLYLKGEEECVQKDPNSGQVDTASCVAHDMGTCFLHNGYHTIRDLVDEYNLTTAVAPEGRAMFSHFAKDSFSSQNMQEYVASSIMDGIKKKRINLPWYAVTKKLKVMGGLLTAVRKYNDFHASHFGKLDFSMPPRPNASVLEKIDMTFAEFLEGNDMHALRGFLMFAQAAQGYGYVTSIPALYGLWWISPELLNGYIQMSFRKQLEKYRLTRRCGTKQGCWIKRLVTWLVGGEAQNVRRTTTMLPEGYEKIWTTMAEKDGLDIRYNIDIQEIDRQLHDPSAPVIIRYQRKEGQTTDVWREEFDFLIYSGPHAHAHKYVSDVVAKEKHIFSQLKSFVLATTLYVSDPVQDYTDKEHKVPIMYRADTMADSSQDGSWYADRYDDIIFGRAWNAETQVRVGYQFYEDYEKYESLKDTDRSPLRNKIMTTAPEVQNQFEEELARQNVTNKADAHKKARILRQFPWPYFHHFGQQAIQDGMPWDLLEMQGESKTWWIGASACFESVHDVTNYNLMLLSKYMGASFQAGKVKKPVGA